MASAIADLDRFQDGVIRRNHVYHGVRQPGRYEVDIAIEIPLAQVARVLFIIECKNWQRPVGRQTVQQLAQTRDAIGAHKAAIASPVGFTSEALQVAVAHGIALWVLARTEFTVVAHSLAGSAFLHVEFSRLREQFIQSMAIRAKYRSESVIAYRLSLMTRIRALLRRLVLGERWPAVNTSLHVEEGQTVAAVLDDHAATAIVNVVAGEALRAGGSLEGASSLGFDRLGWLPLTKLRLIQNGATELAAEAATRAIATGDGEKFVESLMPFVGGLKKIAITA